MDYILCIISKTEFVSLLNNLDLSIPQNRVPANNNPDEMKKMFFKLPHMDFDEDYLILKCHSIVENGSDIEVQLIKIRVESILELIPVTQTALMAYRRKFSSELIWTDSKKYNIEEAYRAYLEEKVRLDSVKIFEQCSRFIFNINGYTLISKDLLNLIVAAKIDKVIRGKKDLNIKKDEYSHAFQSLIVYEQGSHFPRDNAFGFLLHVIGIYILHEGHGESLRVKMNLNNSKLIKKLKEINKANNIKVFNDVFCEQVYKTIDDFRTILNSTATSDFCDLRVMTYFLFYNFLIEEKKLSLNAIFDIVKDVNGELTSEEKTAFLLVAVNSPLVKIAEDIMIKNGEVRFLESPTNTSKNHTNYELIRNYYRTKSNQIRENSGPLLLTDMNDNPEFNYQNILEEIKNRLPSDLKSKRDKKTYFDNIILTEYRDQLIAAAYDIERKSSKDSLFKWLFPDKNK